jgi:hypothetical protein
MLIKIKLRIILEVFGLKSNNYESKCYYNYYLLMITMLKHVFGSDLFECEKIKMKNNIFCLYSIKIDELKEHKYLIDLLDSQKINIKQNTMDLLNFFEDNDDINENDLMKYE